MKPAPDLQTFVCAFGGGVSARVQVDLAWLAARPDCQVVCLPSPTVEGPFKAEHFPLFRAWLAQTWQHISDTARKAVACGMIQPDGRWLNIVCEPGQHTEFQLLSHR